MFVNYKGGLDIGHLCPPPPPMTPFPKINPKSYFIGSDSKVT